MTSASPETVDDGGGGSGSGSIRLIWVVVIGFMLNLFSAGISQRRQQAKHEEILGQLELLRLEIKAIRDGKK